MKKKISEIVAKMEEAVRRNPVEVALSVLYSITGCLEYEEVVEARGMLMYFPVVFLASYVLNYLTREGTIRIVYYLSVLLFVPFLFVKADFFTAVYLVSLAVSVLVYLACSRKKENLPFVMNALSFFQSLLSAFVLSFVAWLLAVSVFFSIQYIFEVFQQSESRFMAYSAFMAFMLVMPLLFLTFNQGEVRKMEGDKVFHILLNYVLSPALLIYAGILYLYFIKVAVLWSLPKGAVAYIVISFASAAFILKGCQPLLRRQYYDWFYNRVGIYVVPALVMYWIGTVYRINEYGFTEDRVYLVVLGVFLSICAVLFFSKRLGRYLYMAYLAVGLLALFTYVPYLSGKDLGVFSQTRRMVNAAKALGMYTPEGKLLEPASAAGEEMQQEYQTLYQAYLYLYKVKGKSFMLEHYDVGLPDVLLDSFIPTSLHDYVLSGHKGKRSKYLYFDVEGQAKQDVLGYRTMYPVFNYKPEDKEVAYRSVSDGIFKIWAADGTLLLEEPLDEILSRQLKQVGIESLDGLARESFNESDPRLFRYEKDSLLFIFDSFHFKNDSVLKLTGIDMEYYLEK